MLTKQHEIVLQAFSDFTHPKAHLEQYSTPANVAVHFINLALEDIRGKYVVDLGCGTGVLTVGAALAGAAFVLGVDVDWDVLKLARRNLILVERVFGVLPVSFAEARLPEFHFRADTVLMNPPFGMRKRGSDALFLSVAMEGADVVWTFLGRESDPFVSRLAKGMGFKWERVKDLIFPLKMSMPFHKRRVKKIEVSVYRLERNRQC